MEMRIDELLEVIFNMSLMAIPIIGVILVVRFILKRAPKIYAYALWLVVLFRLMCPIVVESSIGIFEGNIPETIYNYKLLDDYIEEDSRHYVTSDKKESDENHYVIDTSNKEVLADSIAMKDIAQGIWLVGSLVMIMLGIISFIKIKLKLVGSVRFQDNIYCSDHINTPFVIGVINPRIYLPSNTQEYERAFIISHEKIHIRRFDHITRILAFVVLSIHWFNPLVWLAFILSGKDMEVSCDEAVIREVGEDIRGDYAETLLRFTTGKKIAVEIMPLGFSKTEVGERVKSIMKYKKPVIGVSIFCVILLVVLTLMLGTNSKGKEMTSSIKILQSLKVSDVEKIELIATPGESNNNYCMMTEEMYPEIVQLINMGSGNLVETVEPLAGGGIHFYITKSTGEILTVGNIGNTYLQINNEYFTTDKEWLQKFEKFKGNAPIPEAFHYGKLKIKAEDTPSQEQTQEDGLDDKNDIENKEKDEKNKEMADSSTLREVVDGEVINEIYGEKVEEMIESIIMDALLKSAAWKGIDVKDLDEYYILNKVYSENNKNDAKPYKESSTYYMFLLPKDISGIKKNTPVLQHGLDGMYTVLSNDMYEDCKKLIALESEKRNDANHKHLDYRVTSPILKANDSIGVAVLLDYEDDEKIIFHGYFGLFIYDLVEEEIVFNTDLKYATGTNYVQGDTFVEVIISGDGKTLMAYKSDGLSREDKSDISVLYVDIQTGNHHFEPYKEFESIHPYPELDMDPFQGGTLGELVYMKQGKSYLIFEKYKLY